MGRSADASTLHYRVRWCLQAYAPALRAMLDGMADIPPPSSFASAVFRRWPLVLVPLAVLVFMASCYVLYQPLWERAFRSDDSPVSWLSSALLFANAVVALALVLTSAIPPRLGGAMSAGLLWCALDEQFMLHERFKYGYAQVWFPADALPALWLENLPMVAVGMGGAVCAAWFLRCMGRTSRASSGLMLAALALGVATVAVDLWGEDWWITPFEEGIEVLAESVFLSALFAAAQVQSRSS